MYPHYDVHICTGCVKILFQGVTLQFQTAYLTNLILNESSSKMGFRSTTDHSEDVDGLENYDKFHNLNTSLSSGFCRTFFADHCVKKI
jgi:hypothetical protein